MPPDDTELLVSTLESAQIRDEETESGEGKIWAVLAHKGQIREGTRFCHKKQNAVNLGKVR